MSVDLLQDDSMSLREAMTLALALGERGVHVFPVGLSWDPTKYDGQGGIDKRPLNDHGHTDATTEPREIRRQFNKALARLQPGEVLGVGCCPGRSDRLVVDVDDKGAVRGSDALADLERQHGPLPVSLRLTSPSGGSHILLGACGRHIGNPPLAEGIDIRAHDGWVVAGGTRTPWGEWAWEGGIGLLEGGKVDDAPPWLLDRLAPTNTNGTGDKVPKGPWIKVDPDALHPANLAALKALHRLGGHDEFIPRGKAHVEMTRPGKRAGTSATIGWIGPGIVKVFSSKWPGLDADEVYDADQLEAIADGRPTDDDRSTGERSAPTEDQHTSWEPVDLTAALNGDDVPPATVLVRVDGAALLYAGRTHAFQGESESLKTWAALIAAAQTLEDGLAVVWIDYEDDEVGVAQRLRSLGVAAAAIRERFTYIRPDEPLVDRNGRATPGNVRLGQLLEACSYALAVVDGVTEALSTEGLDLISNADVASWARRLPKRLAATGAAVVTLDHIVKNRGEGASNRYAIGGQHKLAGLTGAAYRFDIVRPLARATGAEPVTGVVTITVVKDRPGHVRAHSTDGRAAVLEITAWPDGGVTASLAAVTGEPAPDLKLVRRIAAYLDQYEGSSKKGVEDNVSGNAGQIRAALRWMAADERCWVRIEKKGLAHLHYLTEAGRALL